MSVATEHIYTLADLDHWPTDKAEFPDGGTALAVIGHPIAHSLSPVMQNAALAALAKTDPQFAKWRYFKFDIHPGDELERALKEFYEKGFLGLNLTVPHKALVVQHLESKAAFVETAGAANTLKSTKTQWWHGENTDGYGLSEALRVDLSVCLKGSHVILLGTGGAARAAGVECLQQNCASLSIGYRTRANVEALLARLRPLAGQIPIHDFVLAQPPTNLPANAVLINATSLGLKPDDKSPLDLNLLNEKPAQVFDMIYRPSQTDLLRKAARMGIPTANGLAMLVHQGARSLEIWTGQSSPVATMQAAAQQALAAH